MTWETIQDFPAGIQIGNVQISASNATGMRSSPFSYAQEVQVFSGQAMAMHVDFLPHDAEQGMLLEAFLLSLRGMAGVFRFFDPYHSKPEGLALGAPVLSSTATAGGQTIDTQGWTPNVAGQLKAGDYLQIGDRLYRTLADASSDANGKATLSVWPDAREAHAAGTRIIVRNATGLWRLANPTVVYGRRTDRKHLTELRCIEAL